MERDTTRMLLVTAGGLLASAILTRALSTGWQKIFKEEPPDRDVNDEINWKKVALWGALTAAIVSTGELVTRRSLSRYLDKHLPD